MSLKVNEVMRKRLEEAYADKDLVQVLFTEAYDRPLTMAQHAAVAGLADAFESGQEYAIPIEGKQARGRVIAYERTVDDQGTTYVFTVERTRPPADPACVPHKVEQGKGERIREQSAAAGMDPTLHPAHGWWLCATHGTWHPVEREKRPKPGPDGYYHCKPSKPAVAGPSGFVDATYRRPFYTNTF